jgi:hypothetical protein
MHYFVELFAVFERVAGGVYGIEKFDEDFAAVDDQRALFHDAVSAGASDRDDGDAGLDGHDDRALFEILQAAVGAAGAFGVNEEGLAFLHGRDSLFEASDGGIVSRAVHGNEMGQLEGLADDGVFEKRFFEKDGDAARDGVDDGGSVGSAGVVGYEQARAGGNAFCAEDSYTDAYSAAEKHGATGTGPVEGVRTFDKNAVDQERDANDDDVQGEEDGDEECAEHAVVLVLPQECRAEDRGATIKHWAFAVQWLAVAETAVPRSRPSRMDLALGVARGSSSMTKMFSVLPPRVKEMSWGALLRRI